MAFKYKTNVQYDFPDNRDWIYRPALVDLKAEIDPPENLFIRNQGAEGSCTGFALAAAIDILKQRESKNEFRASARMLYEMARRHDEWAGEDYSGSSLRGAINGWKHMGVCEDGDWPYYQTVSKRGHLTTERATSARENTIGAYYRLRPQIADMHAALNEVGVVVASARVHKGWFNRVDRVIEKHPLKKDDGGHAFAIVGYNNDGFWVQNSWKKSWGQNGLALWTYPDWIENLMDAWVFRLALPTPSIFGLRPMHSKLLVNTGKNESAEAFWKPSVKRREIAGHFVHVDDGKFAETDGYWSDKNDVLETAKVLGKSDFKHLLIYAHGGLNSPKDSAQRIAVMKETFKKNGIYPYHIMYDTGLAEELKDLIINRDKRSEIRTGGISDRLDEVVEHLTSRTGRMIWNEMKKDARIAFNEDAPGTFALKAFLDVLKVRKPGNRIKLHLVGHSTGAVLIGHLLSSLMRYKATIESVSLLAPACTVDFFHQHYLPVLDQVGRLKVNKLDVYNLHDDLEQDDKVGSKLLYRKSLLYLVSNAFEDKRPTSLLGMDSFKNEVKVTARGPNIFRSNGISGNKTRSKSHGGFDNDPFTMNSVLETVLGKKPGEPFTKKSLKY